MIPLYQKNIQLSNLYRRILQEYERILYEPKEKHDKLKLQAYKRIIQEAALNLGLKPVEF